MYGYFAQFRRNCVTHSLGIPSLGSSEVPIFSIDLVSDGAPDGTYEFTVGLILADENSSRRLEISVPLISLNLTGSPSSSLAGSANAQTLTVLARNSSGSIVVVAAVPSSGLFTFSGSTLNLDVNTFLSRLTAAGGTLANAISSFILTSGNFAYAVFFKQINIGSSPASLIFGFNAGGAFTQYPCTDGSAFVLNSGALASTFAGAPAVQGQFQFSGSSGLLAGDPAVFDGTCTNSAPAPAPAPAGPDLTFDLTFTANFTSPNQVAFGFAISPDFTGIVIGNAEFHSSGLTPTIISFSGGGTFGSPIARMSPSPDRVVLTSSLSLTAVDAVFGYQTHWDSWGRDDSANYLYTNVVSGTNSNPQRIDKGLLVVGVGDYNFTPTGSHRFTSTVSNTGFTGSASKGTLEDLSGFFDVDFGTGVVTNGELSFRIINPVTDLNQKWEVFFNSGSNPLKLLLDGSSKLTYTEGFTITGSKIFNKGIQLSGGMIEGYIAGLFGGFGSNFNGGFQLRQVGNTGNHALGAFIWGKTSIPELSLPEATIESYNISWGKWDNPLEENWVVVTPQANGQIELRTSNHLAMVNPTPIANMQGSASYETTIASGFIGSGSAGDVTQVVAGMDVDLNSGVISNGLLQVEVAGSQVWQIDFAGSVNQGLVDLTATGGSLMNPGGLISNSIDANLGGIFTGNQAEAFVGGFDLIDKINILNQVDGFYTIER